MTRTEQDQKRPAYIVVFSLRADTAAADIFWSEFYNTSAVIDFASIYGVLYLFALLQKLTDATLRGHFKVSRLQIRFRPGPHPGSC